MSVLQEVFQQVSDWMTAYIKSFYNEDKEIQAAIVLKEQHTLRVVAYARQLAVHLKLKQHDCELAALLGLLHDVGRFRQFTIYRTFTDALSEDHAEAGLKVIRELEPVQRLTPEDYDLLCFAIGNHNKKEIAPTTDKRKMFFARFLRDVDKLDIYHVLEPFLGPSDGKGFAPGFLDSFTQGEQVDYSRICTQDDRKLVRLMWVYDVNFAWTLQQLVNKGYIDKILACLPQDGSMQQGEQLLRSYVQKKLNEQDDVSYLYR